MPRFAVNAMYSLRIRSNTVSSKVDEVHLVDCNDDVTDAEQCCDERVPARLCQHALARVDQNHGNVAARSARGHVAGVLLVAGSIRDDEFAFRRREVSIRDVDGDALLALGLQDRP